MTTPTKSPPRQKRHQFAKSRAKKQGRSPGEVVYIGEHQDKPLQIRQLHFDEETLQAEQDISPGDLTALALRGSRWIDVIGVSHEEALKQFGAQFKLHPLVLEDIANTDQRAKVEDHGDYLYLVLKRVYTKGSGLAFEQLSFVLTTDSVISFQENSDDAFGSVRERLHVPGKRIRKRKADYLFYSLIDVVVDEYFTVLDRFALAIEGLETRMMTASPQDVISDVYDLKRELILLRKTIWPLREVLSKLHREGDELIEQRTMPFFRDAYDHCVQIIDLIESFRDVLSSLVDVSISTAGYRTNETMKVLTVIATIFMPLTFIAGVYGMNFKHMPELEQRWAYPAVWIVMLLICAGMLWFFRRKRWW